MRCGSTHATRLSHDFFCGTLCMVLGVTLNRISYVTSKGALLVRSVHEDIARRSISENAEASASSSKELFFEGKATPY
jgi:hypothetical protein